MSILDSRLGYSPVLSFLGGGFIVHSPRGDTGRERGEGSERGVARSEVGGEEREGEGEG